VAFHDVRLAQLKQLDPGVVIIGDSMAGTRINERLLWQLSGLRIAPLLQPGSVWAFWYLALKNWVLASGIRPRLVFIFFRRHPWISFTFSSDRSTGSRPQEGYRRAGAQQVFLVCRK
jgi:hypothetical protein